MRTKHEPETDEQRIAREEREARWREEQNAAEDKSIDAAIKRSIDLHGA
jgi:hypothetical protein